ncbi:MAG: hypothetical protein ABIR26_00975 [Ramlibacter sp.]
MNLTRLWAWRADLAEGFSSLRRTLMGRCKHSRRELVIAACACASELGDSYCSLSFRNILAGLSSSSPLSSPSALHSPP